MSCLRYILVLRNPDHSRGAGGISEPTAATMNVVELPQTNGQTAQHVCLPWAQIPLPAPTGLHPSLSNWAMHAKVSSRLEKMAVTQF